ncbi:acyl carrier protein [Streptomyces sp. NPDC048751]|uniref:acyl carrier protein n=1 Tax=Streptomyces sp. NPDC048751 TaxID=3365591 RepID=UPI001063C979
MAQLTLRDLGEIMLEFHDSESPSLLDTRNLDVVFEDLDCDSLMLLQTTGRIQREYGVELDRERIAAADTPRALLDLVNSALAEVAA